MLQLHSIRTNVEGTDYTLEYTMTKNPSTYELKEICEYGIVCILTGQEGKMHDREEIRCITPDYVKAEKITQCLVKNQVFPVHLKEIVSELLECQLEHTA